jgi:hypothetical protein
MDSKSLSSNDQGFVHINNNNNSNNNGVNNNSNSNTSNNNSNKKLINENIKKNITNNNNNNSGSINASTDNTITTDNGNNTTNNKRQSKLLKLSLNNSFNNSFNQSYISKDNDLNTTSTRNEETFQEISPMKRNIPEISSSKSQIKLLPDTINKPIDNNIINNMSNKSNITPNPYNRVTSQRCIESNSSIRKLQLTRNISRNNNINSNTTVDNNILDTSEFQSPLKTPHIRYIDRTDQGRSPINEFIPRQVSNKNDIQKQRSSLSPNVNSRENINRQMILSPSDIIISNSPINSLNRSTSSISQRGTSGNSNSSPTRENNTDPKIIRARSNIL